MAGETMEKDIPKGITMRMARGEVGKISCLTVASGIDKYCILNTYATDRVAQKDEYILVDANGRTDGYASNLTRVFYLGIVPREEREMAMTASDYMTAVKEAMKPGVSTIKINRICEGYIRDPRFGKFLLHSSRRCIGLNVVECPTVHDETNEELKPGVMFAVENGMYPYDLEKGAEPIYLSFQIEDEVLVTEGGTEWMAGPGELVIEVGVGH